MKIMTAILLSVLFTQNCISQVQVSTANKKNVIGEVKKGGKFLAELFWKQLPIGDTAYFLMYQNREFEYITKTESISFYPEGGALDALYSELKSFFSNKEKQGKDYSSIIEVGSKQVEVSYLKGQILIIPKEGYFLLNEKQLDKLFGKD